MIILLLAMLLASVAVTIDAGGVRHSYPSQRAPPAALLLPPPSRRRGAQAFGACKLY